MSYKVSATIKCWKKYDCLGCGAVFRHRFERSVCATGGTVEQAEAGAQRAGIEALQNQVDTVPCPECGRVQSRMMGYQKHAEHITLLVLLLVAGAVLVPVGANDVLGRDASALVLAGLAAVAAAVHFLITRSDPNRNPQANRDAVARKVEAGEVEVIRAGDPDHGDPPPALTGPWHTACLTLALLGVLAAVAPVALRRVNGWAPSAADPPVLGPGDTFRISFPDKIDCVSSTWSGSPAVSFDGVPVQGAVATSNRDSWGDSMSVKSSEMHTSPTLWADVKLPPDPALQDRSLSGTVTMQVQFPQALGTNGMKTSGVNVSKPFTVQLSKVGAWRSFRAAWWVGLCSSVLLTALAGGGFAWLASRLQRGSPPDFVETLDTPAVDLPPDELVRLRDETRAKQAGNEEAERPKRPWERRG